MAILPDHQCHLPDRPQWVEARQTRSLRPRNPIASPIAQPPPAPEQVTGARGPGVRQWGLDETPRKLYGHPDAKTTALGTGWPR